MTAATHLEQFRAEVANRGQRRDLYRAKVYGPPGDQLCPADGAR